MLYLSNGTFAESQDEYIEYIARLERENAEARREIRDLRASVKAWVEGCKKMIEVEDAVRYGFPQYFRQGQVYLGSTGMADMIWGSGVEARKTKGWLVTERMCYAKIIEHTFRTDKTGRITHIDGRT